MALALKSRIEEKGCKVCYDLWFVEVDHGRSRCESLWWVGDRQIPCTDSLEIEYIEYLEVYKGK